VDLPGYGFAKVADKLRHHWADLMVEYFEGRKSLAGMFLIVDIRRQLTDFDRRMLAFGDSVGLPVHVLLTKTDKLKRGQAATALLEVRRDLGDMATVQHFSALSRMGEEEARGKLEELLNRDRES
jgi:GTP-binding protein